MNFFNVESSSEEHAPEQLEKIHRGWISKLDYYFENCKIYRLLICLSKLKEKRRKAIRLISRLNIHSIFVIEAGGLSVRSIPDSYREYNKSLDPVSWIPAERAGVSNSIKATYVTNHGYVAGLSDYGFDVARAFRSKESCNPLADHIDHCLGGFHRFSPRVAPSHHQLYVWQYIRVAVDLKRIIRIKIKNSSRAMFHL